MKNVSVTTSSEKVFETQTQSIKQMVQLDQQTTQKISRCDTKIAATGNIA